MSAKETVPAPDRAGERRSEDARLFDKLYRALAQVCAHLFPLDTTSVTGSLDSDRSTLMARVAQDGQRYISERFASFTRMGERADAWVVDRLATIVYLDENDTIVVAQRTNNQHFDDDGKPVPGEFTGTREFSALEEADRGEELMRIAENIRDTIGHASSWLSVEQNT